MKNNTVECGIESGKCDCECQCSCEECQDLHEWMIENDEHYSIEHSLGDADDE